MLMMIGLLGCQPAVETQPPTPRPSATPTPLPPPTATAMPGMGGEIAFTGVVGNAVSLFVVGGDGQTPQRLTESGIVAGPRWSPDGRWLAVVTFTNAEGDNAILYALPYAGRTARIARGDWVTLTAPDGIRVLTDGPGYLPVQWLADSRAVVYVGPNPSDGGMNTVWLTSVPGGEARALTPPDGDYSTPAVRGDGAVVVSHRVDGAANLQQVDVTGGALVDVTALTAGVVDSYPAWSPEGERLVWFRQAAQGAGLMVREADGVETVLVAIAGDFAPFEPPVWSPDGTRVAYAVQMGDDLLATEVVIVDVATGAVTTVVTDGRDGFLSWSPDGAALVVTVAAESPTDAGLVVVDAATGVVRNLLDRVSFSTLAGDWR